MRKSIFIFNGFLFLLFLCFSNTFAQKIENPTPCGYASSLLDAFIVKTGPTDHLIVIAKEGLDEEKANLNERRLHNIKEYLTKYRDGTFFSKNPERLLLASGEKKEGLGELSFYLKGELVSIFYVGKNRDLFVGECYYDTEFHSSPCNAEIQKNFYPCLDNKAIEPAIKKQKAPAN